MSSTDPMKIVARGFRFVIRNGDASWRNPKDVCDGDFDATDLSSDEVAEVFIRKRAERKI